MVMVTKKLKSERNTLIKGNKIKIDPIMNIVEGTMVVML